MAGVTKTSKYTYRSTGHGGGDANVSIEYSADLSALTRLEVRGPAPPRHAPPRPATPSPSGNTAGSQQGRSSEREERKEMSQF